MKMLNAEKYSEQEYQTLENYLVSKEQPTSAYEPLSRLVRDETYTILKTQRQK